MSSDRLLVQFFFFFICQLVDSSNGAPFGNRKSGKPSSVFSLFNLKEKSKFWSESVIRSGMIFLFF